MEQPKLPIHGNHCITCESLGYGLDAILNSRSVLKFIKKSPESGRKPFRLSTLPEHLLDSILIKMHYDAFTKLRRSNKNFFEYIENRRERLRIALFHDMSLTLDDRPVFSLDNEYCATFSNTDCPFIPSIDAEYVRRLNKKYANGMVSTAFFSDQSIIINKKKMYGRINHIVLFFNALDFDSDLRKEFTGVYKPYFLEIRGDFKDYQKVINFLNFTRMKKVTLFYTFPQAHFLQTCQILEPRVLKTNSLLVLKESLSQDFLLRSCFKETWAVELSDPGQIECPYPEKLKTLILSSDVEESEIESLLQAWINEENELEELWAQVEGTASLQLFNRVRISEVVKSKKIGKRMNMRVCLLQQRNSKKWAFCAINKQQTTDGNRDVVYFKVLDGKP